MVIYKGNKSRYNNNDNVILDNRNRYEVRVVTVTSHYGAGDKVNDVYKYRVLNLAALAKQQNPR